jgi:hypothetical protein
MLGFILFLVFICTFGFILGLFGVESEQRPRLLATFGYDVPVVKKRAGWRRSTNRFAVA